LAAVSISGGRAENKHDIKHSTSGVVSFVSKTSAGVLETGAVYVCIDLRLLHRTKKGICKVRKEKCRKSSKGDSLSA
jgi:hypothetical protein